MYSDLTHCLFLLFQANILVLLTGKEQNVMCGMSQVPRLNYIKMSHETPVT
jgi:hypothetical protein